MPRVGDAVLACAVVAVCLVVTGPDGALWWLTAAAAAVAVALRRPWPVPMLVVAAGSAAVRLALVGPPTVLDLSVFVLLYTVAARVSRPRSSAALAVLLLGTAAWSGYFSLDGRPAPGIPRLAFHVVKRPSPAAAPIVHRQAPGSWGGLVIVGSALVAAWAVGSGTRSRRAYLAQLRERAEHLERDRDQKAALAVAAERARISRDMHDVVAHGLAMIVIQAQGGAAALDSEPAETRAALEAIVAVGRDALADLRLVVGTVGGADHGWRPRPGLAQLPALVASVEQAGTPVRFRVVGTPVALPSTVDLTAYRIVQEALTNTMKHAGDGAVADVVLAYGPGEVRIEVTDDGRGPVVDPSGGNGLRGMRERVRLLGGRVDAGPAS